MTSSHCQLVPSLLSASSHQSSLEEKSNAAVFWQKMLRLALAACAFDCLLWRRGSKTAAPRAAVPTRGLPAAQKRARRAEKEENDVNFYNATRKAESSLQHRTGSPESRCCRDLVQAPVYFFFTALWSSTFHLHTHSDLLHLHRLQVQVLSQVMVFNIICASLTQVLQNSPAEIFHSFIIDPDHTPLLVTTDLFAK